jgi:hypothetical protein
MVNYIHKTRSKLEDKKRKIERKLEQIDAITIQRDRKLHIRRTMIIGSLAISAAKESATQRQWLLSLLTSKALPRRDAGVVEAFISELKQGTPTSENSAEE